MVQRLRFAGKSEELEASVHISNIEIQGLPTDRENPKRNHCFTLFNGVFRNRNFFGFCFCYYCEANF